MRAATIMSEIFLMTKSRFWEEEKKNIILGEY
jgi:hypothetical protein